jgi:hypothetical protein
MRMLSLRRRMVMPSWQVDRHHHDGALAGGRHQPLWGRSWLSPQADITGVSGVTEFCRPNGQAEGYAAKQAARAGTRSQPGDETGAVMYTNLSYDMAVARQRDMHVRAENERRARQAVQASASQQPGSRRGRRARQLALRLRAQVQS